MTPQRVDGDEMEPSVSVPMAKPTQPAEVAEIHAGLIAGLENGTLRPVVGKQLPLAEAAGAHKEILEPGAAGKIVLVP